MVFFERCVKSVSLIGDSVDRTAETQVVEALTIKGENAILIETQEITGEI